MLYFKDVARTVAEAFKIKMENIIPSNSFNDLGVNYLAYKKLSSLIYSNFDVKILPENLSTFKTIKSLYIYIDCATILKK